MTVHGAFEQIASASVDSIAVMIGERVVTYCELNRLANRLAHRIIRYGVRPGTLIGLGVERSVEAVAGMLGILKAACSFVPLDPAYPDDRLQYLLRDIATPLVLSHRPTHDRFVRITDRTPVWSIDDPASGMDSEENPNIDSAGHAIASVMYTSGSTGTPKGVLVRHSGIVRLVRGNTYCRFAPQDTFLLHSPLTFDASTFEIWGPLLNGGRLAIYPSSMPTLDGIAEVITQFGVTTLWLTAGLFHLMVDQRPEALSGIRQLLAGGDVLSPTHVVRALSHLPENGVLINGYGPTECTTFTCCHPMRKGYRPSGTIPIGRPIAETTLHILDEQMKPVASGDVGELFVGGSGVAAGYLNQPELTAERFVPNPFGNEFADRLYRTGDRVRTLPDGTLEFLGRLDDQLKIAGHRIEPGEIESALREFPGIQQAVVVARPMPSGIKQLVAYLVVPPRTQVDLERIKDELAHRLPRYLIPSDIIILGRIPLTPNGKVDRAALSSIPLSGRDSLVVDLNATNLEKKIIELWRSTLQREVSLDQNFFDLGGSSLQLLSLHAELTTLMERPIAVTELFEHTTIRALAFRLSQSMNRDVEEVPADDRAKRQRDAYKRRREEKGQER